MSVPKFYEMHRFVLEALKDGKPHTFKECYNFVADKMHLSDADRKITLGSGQKRYVNRCGWSRTYLKKAGFLTNPKVGTYIITKLGQEVLKNGPKVITDEYLLQFPSFKEFLHGNKKQNPSLIKSVEQDTGDATPEDALDSAYNKINSSLESQLLELVMQQDSDFFEHLVVQLLQKIGYGAALENSGIVTKKVGDEGIDGVIREDKLGFSSIYIQAKRWDISSTVGRPEIQKFVGALADQGGAKGLFITTAKFSKEAQKSADKQHVVLIDGEKLSKLMVEYDLGVSTIKNYAVKKIDTDFFNEEE